MIVGNHPKVQNGKVDLINHRQTISYKLVLSVNESQFYQQTNICLQKQSIINIMQTISQLKVTSLEIYRKGSKPAECRTLMTCGRGSTIWYL